MALPLAFVLCGVGNPSSHWARKSNESLCCSSHRWEGVGQRGVGLRPAGLRGWRPPSPAPAPRRQLLWGRALVELCLHQVYTDAENRSSVRPVLWVIQRTKSFFKTLPRLSTGVEVTDSVDMLWGKKSTILSDFEASRNIWQVWTVSSPHFLFNQLLLYEAAVWRQGAVYSSPHTPAAFPAHWFFNMKRQNFLHNLRNGACILKIHQLSLLFAWGFVSFHTSLKPPLCSERTVPSCEERRGAGTGKGDLREHPLFS